jgi:hypothetical protein
MSSFASELHHTEIWVQTLDFCAWLSKFTHQTILIYLLLESISSDISTYLINLSVCIINYSGWTWNSSLIWVLIQQMFLRKSKMQTWKSSDKFLTFFSTNGLGFILMLGCERTFQGWTFENSFIPIDEDQFVRLLYNPPEYQFTLVALERNRKHIWLKRHLSNWLCISENLSSKHFSMPILFNYFFSVSITTHF